MDLTRTPNAEKKRVCTGKLDWCSNAVGFACRKGRKPGSRSPNQDSWCVHRTPQKSSVYGVFDGHGEKGHIVSDYVKQVLTQKVIQASQCTAGDSLAKVQAIYQQAQKSLMEKPHLGVQMSGTTATIVVHDNERERLFISHVGDSTAAIIRNKAGGAHELEGVALTRDHKPNLPDERARIEKHGRIQYDGYCHRVVKKHGSGPGLNMSRSLGDAVAHNACGVSAEPEIAEYMLTSQDHALLVCSDGIWEVISPQEAADIVKDFSPWQASEAAQKLADEAVARWLRGTQGQMTDDITVVLAFLHQDGKALCRVDTGSTAAPSHMTVSPTMEHSIGMLRAHSSSWSESSSFEEESPDNAL